jgi:hypothetical protein
MVVTDTLEGTVNQTLWYHYDVPNDVLYLRFQSEREAETVSEETPSGILLVRRLDTDAVVGWTVVNWWPRFGKGKRDSIRDLERSIESTIQEQLTEVDGVEA